MDCVYLESVTNIIVMQIKAVVLWGGPNLTYAVGSCFSIFMNDDEFEFICMRVYFTKKKIQIPFIASRDFILWSAYIFTTHFHSHSKHIPYHRNFSLKILNSYIMHTFHPFIHFASILSIFSMHMNTRTQVSWPVQIVLEI